MRIKILCSMDYKEKTFFVQNDNNVILIKSEQLNLFLFFYFFTKTIFTEILWTIISPLIKAVNNYIIFYSIILQISISGIRIAIYNTLVENFYYTYTCKQNNV